MINFYLRQSFIFTNFNKRDLDFINSTISSSDQIQKQAFIENRNTVETLTSIRSSSLSSDDLSEVAELYSISQGGKTIRGEQGNLISTDKIPPTAIAISTC